MNRYPSEASPNGQYFLFPFPNAVLFRNSTERSFHPFSDPQSRAQKQTNDSTRCLELHQVRSVALAQGEGRSDVSSELGNLLDVGQQSGVNLLLVSLADLGGLLLL
jgi:hypothetical protein